MSTNTTLNLAIGGVGGSGTRVVADVVRQCGYYIGDTLNPALDNLWFSLLLRQPSWAVEFPEKKDIENALKLFVTVMEPDKNEPLTADQKNYIRNLPESQHFTSVQKENWALVASSIIEKLNTSISSKNLMGWKEPNTHIFLPQLNTLLPNIKYVHVIRNGFYMARSKNQNQVRAWHRIFDISIPSTGVNPTVSLDYWIKANERAIKFGHHYMKNRFYLLDYNKLCDSPVYELSALFDFLEISYSQNSLDGFSKSIVKKNTDNLDNSMFSESQMQSVENIMSVDKHRIP